VPAQPAPSVSGSRTAGSDDEFDWFLGEPQPERALTARAAETRLLPQRPSRAASTRFENHAEPWPRRLLRHGLKSRSLTLACLPPGERSASAPRREPPGTGTEAMEARLAELGAGLAHGHETQMELAVAAAVMQVRGFKSNRSQPLSV
jgi:hypothetical protein